MKYTLQNFETGEIAQFDSAVAWAKSRSDLGNIGPQHLYPIFKGVRYFTQKWGLPWAEHVYIKDILGYSYDAPNPYLFSKKYYFRSNKGGREMKLSNKFWNLCSGKLLIYKGLHLSHNTAPPTLPYVTYTYVLSKDDKIIEGSAIELGKKLGYSRRMISYLAKGQQDNLEGWRLINIVPKTTQESILVENLTNHSDNY